MRGLFRGLTPTIITNAPFSGLYYLFYSRLKQQLQRLTKVDICKNYITYTWQGSAADSANFQDEEPTVAITFSAGVVAAMAATLITQPTDMVRTQMQLGLALGRKMSALATLQTLLRSPNAPRRLMAGIVPRVRPWP